MARRLQSCALRMSSMICDRRCECECDLDLASPSQLCAIGYTIADKEYEQRYRLYLQWDRTHKILKLASNESMGAGTYSYHSFASVRLISRPAPIPQRVSTFELT